MRLSFLKANAFLEMPQGDGEKVCAISNPVVACGDESVKKENILYVGRMSRTEKRVIDVWRQLAPLMSD